MKKNSENIIVTNRKAYRDYHIIDTYEAGIELHGTEVKSLRQKRGNCGDSFAKIMNGEAFLFNFHISPYEFGNVHNHDPLRTRKLLLHKLEINKLAVKSGVKGYALIPLKLYFKRGRVKVELALGQGKTVYDKRHTIRKKEADREMQRAMRTRSKK